MSANLSTTSAFDSATSTAVGPGSTAIGVVYEHPHFNHLDPRKGPGGSSSSSSSSNNNNNNGKPRNGDGVEINNGTFTGTGPLNTLSTAILVSGLAASYVLNSVLCNDLHLYDHTMYL
jgi:hypothetical protein